MRRISSQKKSLPAVWEGRQGHVSRAKVAGIGRKKESRPIWKRKECQGHVAKAGVFIIPVRMKIDGSIPLTEIETEDEYLTPLGRQVFFFCLPRPLRH